MARQSHCGNDQPIKLVQSIHMKTNYLPRGAAYSRAAIAKALELSDVGARSRWGHDVVKSAVSAMTSTDFGTPEAMEFFDQVLAGTIVGRLPLRRVPFRIRTITVTGGATGYWVGQGKHRPLSKAAVLGGTIDPLNVAALVVLTKEALEFSGDVTEAGIQRDIERAVVEAMDSAFIDASNAGIAGEMPASVTHGAPQIASTGDPAADLAALVGAFQGGLMEARFLTDPTTATRLALARDSGGAFLFPDLGPKGGTLLGIPVLTSRASPRDTSGGQIVLLDPDSIAYGYDGGTVDRSLATTIRMSDNPETEDGTTVSLWQCNLAALLAQLLTNWKVQHTGAVVTLTGVLY